jgi:phosphatidylinositol-3-phosphatase
MGPLAGIRIGAPALAVLACVSALASVVIIHIGEARTPAQTAALATLAARRQVLAQVKSAHASAPAPAPPAAAPVTAAAQGMDGSAGSGSSGGGGAGGGTAGSGAGSAGAAPAGSGSGSDAGTGGTGTTSTSTTAGTTPAPNAGLPHVGHVFLLALSTPSYRAAFGRGSPAPYLRSLVAHGTLLSGFASLGHGELADELAMVSGQAPNADTSAGCTTYSEYPPTAGANAAGEVSGNGCVYPEAALNIGDQVTSDGKVWGAYMAGMGTVACQHPNSNTATDVPLPGTEPGYDLLHNPFVFFHSVLDDGDCSSDDQDLSRLPAALSRAGRTPRFVYVGADACSDADPVPAPASPTAPGTPTSSTTSSATTSQTATTVTTTSTAAQTTTSTVAQTTTGTTTGAAAPAYGCPSGEPSGLAAEDAFLKTWVPKITGSAAYRQDGVLVIAFAGSRSTGHPVTTGALVLSRWTPAHRRIATAYGPYALLRSAEDMLNDTPLAHAAKVAAFAKEVLSG